MRGWRRSSRARARNGAYADAPAPDAAPNPFAQLAWRPPSADLPPIAAPPFTAPPIATPPAAPALVEAPPAAAATAPAPVEALLVDRSPEPELHLHEPVATAPTEERPVARPDPAAPVEQRAPQAAAPAPTATATGGETSPELLRLFEVVTNMCDHVIEYIESDRAERRVMLETLATLGRAITDSAAALASRTATATAIAIEPAETRVIQHPEPRERVIGGSMPAGPDPVIDLRNAPAAAAPTAVDSAPPAATPSASAAPASTPVATTTTVMTTEIAVEVRGRFGDRWVDGFEICEVMETPEGHRYRLRRHRDGVVLPELFDATSIRHVETFDQLATTNGSHTLHGNGQTGGRDASVNDATGYAGASVNGTPTHWSRS